VKVKNLGGGKAFVCQKKERNVGREDPEVRRWKKISTHEIRRKT